MPGYLLKKKKRDNNDYRLQIISLIDGIFSELTAKILQIVSSLASIKNKTKTKAKYKLFLSHFDSRVSLFFFEIKFHLRSNRAYVQRVNCNLNLQKMYYLLNHQIAM